MALVLALGCGDDKNNPTTGGGTDGSTGGTSEGTTNPSTTDPTTTNGTTDNSGTMGGTQTTDPGTSTTTTTTTTSETTSTTEPLTTGTQSTSETSIGSSTGGGGSIEEECGIACDKFIECRVFPEPDACVQDCVMNLGGEVGACLEANEALLSCFGTMTCMEVVDFFENDNPGPCAAQFGAVAMACEGDVCEVGQGGNPQGTECSISIQCPNDPLLEMNCNKNECVCVIDGMPAGEPCPADEICKMQEGLADKANECCGF